ncbi:MAG: hypothetical protein AABN33_29865, partial [Acidobacteriota bacterium]
EPNPVRTASSIGNSEVTRYYGLPPALSTGSRTRPCRHPLRGLVLLLLPFSTGSRTHPWLYAATRFAG